MKSNWSKEYPITCIEKKDFNNNFLLRRLLEIPDCPEKIFFRGNMENNESLEKFKFLAVVGSRSLSTYGKDVIKFLLEGLIGENICVISGLAMGADSEAHTQAMKNNLWTIVVPGSGINEDVLYPATNKKLANEILEKNGLFLNEFEPEFKSTLWSFPARNRIMAAISDAVLIIEASDRSGTLITARLATEYNKDVLCVPGQIFQKNSYGTNKLISEGAKIIRHSYDILEALNLKTAEDKINAKKNKERKVKDISKLNLTQQEKMLWDKLEESQTRDILQDMSGLNISDFLMALTLLEMKNLIQEEAGLVRRVY